MTDTLDEPCSGPVRFAFGGNRGRLITNLIVAGGLTILGLGVFPVGFLYDFPEPVLNKRVIAILFGVIWISLSGALFVITWRKLGQRVLVFSDGFLFHQSGHDSVCEWEEIAAVWRDSSTVGSAAMVETDLRIDMKNGRSVYLATSSFLGMERFVDVLLSETLARMLPKKMAAIRQGNVVEFGEVTVNTAGLQLNDDTLVWSAIMPVEVAHGLITIRRKPDGGVWHRNAVKRTPNYHVFLAVVAEMHQDDTAPGQHQKTM